MGVLGRRSVNVCFRSPFYFMTEQDMKAGVWFATWMADRCPIHISKAQFVRVTKKFLEGHLIVVCSRPVTPETAKVEIWAG